MSRLAVVVPAVFFACLMAGVCRAGFDQGVDAYEKGDFATAIKEWTPLATKGDEAAQFNLGVIYEKAKGVPRDNKQAAYWYRAAAEKGHAKAMLNIAFCYANGMGVGQNYQEAFIWMRKAADKGVLVAQYNLAKMLYNGWGTARNRPAAIEWMRLAVKQGMSDAQKDLDIMEGKNGQPPPDLLQ